MKNSLKTQVQAIQSRINSVTESATPEDLVMLAKAVEAVGGQATVFDIIDAGDESREKALADIDAARQSAVATVIAAGGITQDMLDDIASLQEDVITALHRPDPDVLVLAGTANVLPDANKGSYVLTTDTNTSAVLSLPKYTGTVGAMRCYTLINDSSFVINMRDDAGGNVGNIQPHGFCFAFVTGDEEKGWQWKSSRSDEGGANVIFDQPLLVLDGLPTAYMQMLPMPDGFLVCWTYSGTFKLSYLRWKDGALVQSELFSTTEYVGVADFCVDKAGAYKLILAWTYNYGLYAAVIDITVAASVSVTFVEPITVITGSSSSDYGEPVLKMYSEQRGFVAAKYTASSNYSEYVFGLSVSRNILTAGSPLSIRSDSPKSNLSIQALTTNAAGVGLLMDSPVASMYATTYLSSFTYTGSTTAPMKVHQLAYGFADMGTNIYSQMVTFLNNTLALCCWWNLDKLHWRLVNVDTAGKLTMGSLGMVAIPDVYRANNRNTYIQVFVLSETEIALVVAGNLNAFPRVLFGSINASGTDITWGDTLIDFPFSVKSSSATICACYDIERNAMLVAEQIGSTSPIAIVAKF